MSLPPNAFILAAGYGSRLRPLTDTTPKPLLPCMGVPLIDITLYQLQQHGVQHTYINTHHLPDKFAYLSAQRQELESNAAVGNARLLARSSHSGMRSGAERESGRRSPQRQVTLLHEPTLLGSAGVVHNLNQDARNHDLIVYNGDILSDIDFAALYQTHLARQAIATLALLPTTQLNTQPVYVHDGQLVACDASTRQGHPSAHTFACAQVWSVEFLQLIVEHNFTHIKDAWQYALARRYPIATFLHRGLWYDIGTPVNFFKAHQALHQKLQCDPDFLHIATLLGKELHLHDEHVIVGTPHIDKSCLIKTQTFITSSRVTIHAPAQLDHCVVMHDAIVCDSHSHTLLLGKHTLACG